MTDELVQGYLSLRKRLAYKLGPDDAADIAQTAVEYVLRYARNTHVLSPAGLLARVAGHLQIDRGRQRARAPVPLDEEVIEALGSNITPEREMAARQTLMQLLDALPPRCRQAFILCQIQGMTYHEAAAEMAISPTVVRQYLVEARRICRSTSP